MAAETGGERRHGCCVALAGRGLLISGRAGGGKSRLVGTLLAAGAWLVADDQVELVRAATAVWARAPVTGKGLLEQRGLGIFRLPGPGCARLVAVLELAAEAAVERLPEPTVEEILGVAIPRVRLPAEPEPPMAAVLITLLLAREA